MNDSFLSILCVRKKGTEKERQRFELLRKAYVDARYDENYTITKVELKWLAGRVNKLQKLTKKICKKKIKSLTGLGGWE